MNKDKSRFRTGSWVKRFDGTIGMTVVHIIASNDQASSEDVQVRCKFKDSQGEEKVEVFSEKELVEL